MATTVLTLSLDFGDNLIDKPLCLHLIHRQPSHQLLNLLLRKVMVRSRSHFVRLVIHVRLDIQIRDPSPMGITCRYMISPNLLNHSSLIRHRVQQASDSTRTYSLGDTTDGSVAMSQGRLT